MNQKLSISIPKPCHENWNKMTPKEKGRFCSSCSKTVIDFTKKSSKEIKEYLIKNKNLRVCGHFYKKQLDTIVIEIPEVTFRQQLSFQKIFILALLFVMGTTLFSCKYADGKKQKIENVILIDSIKKTESKFDSLTIFNTKDSTYVCAPKQIIPEKDTLQDTLIDITTTGTTVEVIETVGINTIEGDIEYEEIEVEEDDFIVGMIIEDHPRFEEAKHFSRAEAKEDFDDRIKNFVQENFDTSFTENLDLSAGKYRIFTQFNIDKFGNVTDIKVRAPHPKLEKVVDKIFKKLPQLISGKQAGKVVKTRYNLPITFMI